MDEIQRLLELLSDTTTLAIWDELRQYTSKGEPEDQWDARRLRLQVEEGIDYIYGMDARDLAEYVLALEEMRQD